MRTLTFILIAMCLAHQATGARVLHQREFVAMSKKELPSVEEPAPPIMGADVPVIRGTNNKLQETPEYKRYNQGADAILQNQFQAETQQGGTLTGGTAQLWLETTKVGQTKLADRVSLGQNQAQGIVGNAPDAPNGGSAAVKDHFGTMQYQAHGLGLQTGSDVRTSLANLDAHTKVSERVAAGDAAGAAQAGSDSAWVTVYGATTHKFTD